MVSLDRRSSSPMFAIFIPSTTIDPKEASIIRNNAKVSDDLPAPVLPTIPTYKQYMIYHDRFHWSLPRRILLFTPRARRVNMNKWTNNHMKRQKRSRQTRAHFPWLAQNFQIRTSGNKLHPHQLHQQTQCASMTWTIELLARTNKHE